MKKLSYSLPFLSLMLAIAGLIIVASCTREELVEPQEESGPAFEIVGEPVDVHLAVTVGGLDASLTTRAEDDSTNDLEESDAEKQINDLWVFQYDATETEDVDMKLIMIPQHLTITKQEQLADLQVRLSNNNDTPSIIYVVTNTNSSDWVKYDSTTESYSGFMTLADLKANTIPTPEPQMLTWDYETEKYVNSDEGEISIPMAGSQRATVGEGEVIKVNVERMYAKLCIKVDLRDFNTTDYNGALVYNVTVSSIPSYSTVGPLWSETDQTNPANYSKCSQWIERTFNSSTDDDAEYNDDVYPYVIYVPENIQGETTVISETDKAQNIPAAVRTTNSTDALAVVVNIDAITKDGATMGPYAFYGYPGGNGVNNFNVRRNCVYEVTMKIDNLNEEDLAVPSANCIVCLSDKTTTFFPYCRPEKGGGYKFSTYVDNTYSETSDGSKRISYIKILWQSESVAGRTGGFLGDNSDWDYVKIDDAPTTGDDEAKTKAEYVRKISIYVPEGESGNALIAAYNSSDKIIWSWHIWCMGNVDPSNVANGVTYFTYDWDNTKIYSYIDKDSREETGYPRIPGYTLMNCNLGAMATTETSSSTTKSYGLLYQWGRKDPFPGSIVVYSEFHSYTSEYIGNYYDNENNQVGMTADVQTEGELFYSLPGSERVSTIGTEPLDYIQYSVNNPTVFMCGTTNANQNSLTAGGYPTPGDGNWIYDPDEDHCNTLWGGLDPENEDDLAKISKSLNLYTYVGSTYRDSKSRDVHLYDDYGDAKSIFDPCPYGWRVSPPDLWLGFTDTGLNPAAMTDVNYSGYTNHGFNMYMGSGWKSGSTSFFPCAGYRSPDGTMYRAGTCGNYENATSDAGNRVNILHLHNDSGNFKLFEFSNAQFYIKSTGGSVRCVNTASVSSSTSD